MTEQETVRLSQHIEEINHVNGTGCQFIMCGDFRERICSLNTNVSP